MPDPKEPKIAVFEGAPTVPVAVTTGDRPLQARGVADRVVQIVETSVGTLQASMDEFLSGLSAMLANAESKSGAFAVDTIEVQCEISGSGKIGFAGTGVDLSGGSTLKLVLKRKA
jgi:hypothetical protein